MTTVLLADQIRGTRRVRFLFSGPLAAGAFTSTSYYSVTSADFGGFSPITVEAVFAIATDANAVEISVSEDLTPGDLYNLSVTAVPTVDSSDPSGTLQDRPPLPIQDLQDTEPQTSDIDLLFYNRDLLHDGLDFVETASGDLATTSGQSNWLGALNRRTQSYGIKWDPAYGAGAYTFVDAPQPYAVPLAGQLLAQCRADNRTQQATVDVAQSPSDPGQWVFNISVIGKDGLNPQTITVPVPSSGGSS